MKYRYLFFLLLFFFLISLISLQNNSRLRCSSFGHKYLDDILGLELGLKECVNLNGNNIVSENKNTNEDQHVYNKDLRYQFVTNKKKYSCPESLDVIVILGQSNAANHLLTNEYENTSNFNFYENSCYSLSDPVLGTTGKMGSIVPAIASKLNNKKPIIFITNAWGGSSILSWSSNDSYLTKYARDNIRKVTEKNILKYIIWIQGETDIGSDINYFEQFLKFKNNLFFNIDDSKIKDVKFIVTQTSKCNGVEDTKLSRYQKKLSSVENIILTEVTDNLDENYRYDGCHYNSFGTEIIASEISKIINSEY